jgi:hypothetical protein
MIEYEVILFLGDWGPHAPPRVRGLDEQTTKIEVGNNGTPGCIGKTFILSTPNFADNLLGCVDLETA